MKSTDTHKVVLPTGDIAGKATAPAFDQIMNLLIKILTKLGLLKKDLDYHVVRASMVIIYFFTILPFMPDGWNAAAGGFPAMQGNVAFLMKDLVLFAVSFYLLKQDVERVALKANSARPSPK